MLYVPAGVPWKIVCVVEPVVLLPHADAIARIKTMSIVAIPTAIAFSRGRRAFESRGEVKIAIPSAAASNDISATAVPVRGGAGNCGFDPPNGVRTVCDGPVVEVRNV